MEFQFRFSSNGTQEEFNHQDFEKWMSNELKREVSLIPGSISASSELYEFKLEIKGEHIGDQERNNIFNKYRQSNTKNNGFELTGIFHTG